MQTVLFHSTIFGPIHSRRLGVSLGVNLTPDDGKICTFDCLYCEAGFNAQGPGTTGFPSRERVARLLESRLKNMKEANQPLDVITFSGNGEPTLHPHFKGVIEDTIRIRDKYYPEAKVSVLSNSTRLENPDVAAALRMVDNNILKLDSAITTTMRAIDRPTRPSFTSEQAIDDISRFGKQCIIQTMFLRGKHDGVEIDNTTPTEVDALIEAYKKIGPCEVMIYSIDRKTPAENLEKVSKVELQAIAENIVKETGIQVQVA
ncbi:MAG: radical SAM protein [Duncaniella sp.]|nr:radical SAM protein [Muribaculum sp.]MCM1255065.1 radical SAM protein [Duncaniella sp.]